MAVPLKLSLYLSHVASAGRGGKSDDFNRVFGGCAKARKHIHFEGYFDR